MIGWVNFTILIVVGIIMTVFYLMSVRPAALPIGDFEDTPICLGELRT